MTKKILFTGVFFISLATTAFAAPKVSLIGLGTLARPTYTDATLGGVAMTASTRWKSAYGGGFLLEFPLSPYVGLELGALYVPKKFELSITNASPAYDWNQTVEYNTLRVPLALKVRVSRYFNIGLGGYFAQGFGTVLSTASDGTSSRDGFKESYMKTSDYGLLGTATIVVPMGGAAFLLGAQYAYGLADTFEGDSQFVGKMKTADIHGFAGLRFGGGR